MAAASGGRARGIQEIGRGCLSAQRLLQLGDHDAGTGDAVLDPRCERRDAVEDVGAGPEFALVHAGHHEEAEEVRRAPIVIATNPPKAATSVTRPLRVIPSLTCASVSLIQERSSMESTRSG